MTPRYPITKPTLSEAEARAVARVLETGWVTQGPAVARFEQVVATYCGARHAVAVSSCTAALHLALLVAGVLPGDEVIVPSMSFIATANAVVHARAEPVFAEVDKETFNIGPQQVKACLSKRVRAVIAVHQLGLPADLSGLRALTADAGIPLVEDAACALGSRYHGVPIGGSGELVCFSFHPRKLITTGEGGMVLTSSDAHAQRLRRLRNHGMSVSDIDRHASSSVVHETYEEVGFNYRMSDIQASIGIEQLGRLDDILAYRRELANCYGSLLMGNAVVSPPCVPPGIDWNVQSYAVRLEGVGRQARNQIMQLMLDEGIATRPGVMTAHREPAYTRSREHVTLPQSEEASDSSLMLPLHGEMREDDCKVVVDSLNAAIERVIA